MRHTGIFAIALSLAAASASAQTVNVCTGSVIEAYNASADEMPYTEGGQMLNIGGKTYNTLGIDSIYIDDSTVADNTVSVTYNGSSARVVIAGNIAPYLTTTVSDAHVTILQSADVTDEITYTLSGTSDSGSFYMDGELKATIVLNGLTLTSTDSAAINIRDGKRIAVEIADGTVNILTDAASGSQKACFMVNGHTEFKGGGQLYINGNAKHAFWGDEYVELKKSVGSITITSAVKDGMNINQYLEMKGGVLTVSGTGDDGIQVTATDDTSDEQNGQVIISGGTLKIDVTATAAKGLKCDSLMTINDGTIDITTTGNGEYDSDERDCSGSSCLKTDGNAVISGGTLTLKSTGSGGKGIHTDGDLTINGGTITVTTTGKQYTYGSLDASPKGIKADANLTISGGVVTVTATGGEGSEGIESKNTMTITDGEVIVNTYDDALNAANALKISGGKVYACSTKNDGIDSNGTLTISGGLVISCGTEAPEGGFDCDQNTFTVTGGTIIGIGGDTSTPTTSVTTQPVMILGSQSYTSGTYITLAQSGSTTPVFAFKLPQTYREASLLISDPSLSTGNTYTIGSGATVTGGTEWQGYTTDATISGGSTKATLTLNSMVTQQNGGSSGPGGGGGHGGGGW